MAEKEGYSVDIFDDVVMAEERSQDEGYQAGLTVGRGTGLQEGFKLGWEKGGALASEIGFYRGFSVNLIQLMDEDPKKFKEKVVKSVRTLASMTENFTIRDPKEEQMFEDLNAIRSKFKQVTSLLKIDVDTEEAAKNKGLSF